MATFKPLKMVQFASLVTTGKKKSCDLEVDHCVAYALWSSFVATKPLETIDDATRAEYEQTINSLGNCTLLEKSFNISKSTRTFKDFLSEVHEFRDKPDVVGEWSAALELAPCLISPTADQFESISTAIDARDQSVRKVLEQFIRGAKLRVDIT